MFHYITEEGVIFLCITGDVRREGGREGGEGGREEGRRDLFFLCTGFRTLEGFHVSRAHKIGVSLNIQLRNLKLVTIQ